MGDGYLVDSAGMVGLAGRLARAEGALGAATGGEPDPDAGQSTGTLAAALAVMAQSMSALSQAAAKANSEVRDSDTTYQDVESRNARNLAGEAD